MAIGAAGITAVSANHANALPLTFISHSGTAMASAQVTVGVLDTDTDSTTSAIDTGIFTNSSSALGPGSAHGQARAGALSFLSDTATENVLRLDQSSRYLPPNPFNAVTNPGGNGEFQFCRHMGIRAGGVECRSQLPGAAEFLG